MSKGRRLPKLTVIYWRDIPAQVTAQDEGRSERIQLSERFQKAIDAAAVEAELVGADQYLDQWRKDTRQCENELGKEVAAEASRLEAIHPSDVLRRLVNAGGLSESESGD